MTCRSDPALRAVTEALPQALRNRDLLVSAILGIQGTEREILGVLNEVELALVERFLESHPWLRGEKGAGEEARRLGGIPDLQAVYLKAKE